MEFSHKPVLLEEVLENLKIRPDGIYADGTLGGAGHSMEIASRLSKEGLLIGVDRDKKAVEVATKRLFSYSDRVRIFHRNYTELPGILKEQGIAGADGILLDLGVSSYQLDNADRGFTYRDPDAPLDMRMDDRDSLTAETIVNTYSEKELARILREYGEERFASNIARNIVAEREKEPLTTAGSLLRIIERSIPKKMRATGGHPAKRTFQAIRIECNDELGGLERSLDAMIDLLRPGGRLLIITFHSLEDRIVKNAFQRNESPCTCPKEFPVCVCGKKSKGKAEPRRPIRPTEGEMEENPRSKSAKLRVFVRE